MENLKTIIAPNYDWIPELEEKIKASNLTVIKSFKYVQYKNTYAKKMCDGWCCVVSGNVSENLKRYVIRGNAII